MKRLILTLGILIFIMGFSFAQSKGVVKIIVLPQHEENFNKFISWLKEDELFKNKVNFIKSSEEAFRYAKAGDYENYARWLNIFKSELEKLSDVEKNRYNDFLSKLTIVDISEVLKSVGITEVPGGRCAVNCAFGSCVVLECEAKAVCTCVGGYPYCECG